MKKGWKSKNIKENAWGLKFTRWYIKSPNGNFYHIYRGCYSSTIRIAMDIKDYKKSQIIGYTFAEAIQELYKLEAAGTYPKTLSDDVQNCRECKYLYKEDNPSCSYSWA